MCHVTLIVGIQTATELRKYYDRPTNRPVQYFSAYLLLAYWVFYLLARIAISATVSDMMAYLHVKRDDISLL